MYQDTFLSPRISQNVLSPHYLFLWPQKLSLSEDLQNLEEQHSSQHSRRCRRLPVNHDPHVISCRNPQRAAAVLRNNIASNQPGPFFICTLFCSVPAAMRKCGMPLLPIWLCLNYWLVAAIAWDPSENELDGPGSHRINLKSPASELQGEWWCYLGFVLGLVVRIGVLVQTEKHLLLVKAKEGRFISNCSVGCDWEWEIAR